MLHHHRGNPAAKKGRHTIRICGGNEASVRRMRGALVRLAQLIANARRLDILLVRPALGHWRTAPGLRYLGGQRTQRVGRCGAIGRRTRLHLHLQGPQQRLRIIVQPDGGLIVRTVRPDISARHARQNENIFRHQGVMRDLDGALTRLTVGHCPGERTS